MQREAKTIFDYWTNREYRCIFKKNTDTNQISNNNLTIFYLVSEAIEEGDLLNFKGKTFLVQNKDTYENEIYYRSDLLETSIVMETYSNQKELQIPCFAYDLLNVNPVTGQIISIVNGSIELLTQKNAYTDNLEIGSNFTGLGGTYQIINTYYKSNILHIFVERKMDATPITYKLKIDAEPQYSVGSTHRLKATATRTESTSTVIVTNPTIQWSSSDISISIVSATGDITCLKAGTVAITATWVEHSITEQVAIEVTDPATTPKVCEITGEEEIIYGTEEIYTAKFYDAAGNVDDTITPVWSLELPPTLEGKVQLIAPINKEVTVAIAEDEKIINSVFNLKLTDTNGEYEEIKSLKICGWFRKKKADTE